MTSTKNSGFDGRTPVTPTGKTALGHTESLLTTVALQSAIFNSANFSSIATDAKGVIQIFNVGAERMLGYTAAEVMNKITPADISDPQEVIARAKALSWSWELQLRQGSRRSYSKRRVESKTSMN